MTTKQKLLLEEKMDNLDQHYAEYHQEESKTTGQNSNSERVASCPAFNIGDKIKVKDGATRWMKQRNYWLECMGDNIDGFSGTITNDYTDLSGDDAHYGVNIGFDYLIGIHPQWLEAV